MATIKIDKRCGGPLNWETVDGGRKLVPLGICGEEIHLEYDDDTSLEAMVGRIFAEGNIHCEKCGRQGEHMIAVRDYRRQRMMDIKMGYRKGKPSGHEEAMMF